MSVKKIVNLTTHEPSAKTISSLLLLFTADDDAVQVVVVKEYFLEVHASLFF